MESQITVVESTLIPASILERVRAAGDYWKSVESIKITTPQESLAAADVARVLMDLEKRLDADYEMLMAPRRDEDRKIRAFFKIAEDLKAGRKKLAQADREFQAVEAEKARLANARLEAEAEAKRVKLEAEAEAIRQKEEALRAAGKDKQADKLVVKAENKEMAGLLVTASHVPSAAPKHSGRGLTMAGRWKLVQHDPKVFLAHCIATPELHRLVMINDVAGNNLATETKAETTYPGAVIKKVFS